MNAAPEIPQRVKFSGGRFVPEFPEECEPHTRGPESYLARQEWFEGMALDHIQRQCKGCGLWAVWEPKPATAPEAGNNSKEEGR